MNTYKHIKQAFLLLFALFWALSLNAQLITQAEYFFDTDPGIGNGTALTLTADDTVNVSASVSISGLSPGFHKIFVRYMDSNNKWSLYEGRTFYIESHEVIINPTQVKVAEYFFDTDPGIGNGTALTFTADDTVSINESVSIAGLDPGFHKVFVRYKDDKNLWSLYEGRTFYVEASVSATASTHLVAAEYFFDTDPGIGNGTAITISPDDTVSITETVSTSGLTPGFHKVFVRYKDDKGLWSLYEGRTFYIESLTSATPANEIIAAEYFFNEDPGIGNATAIAVTADDTLSTSLSVSVNGLNSGFHKLVIRVKDNNEVWSSIEGRTFYIEKTTQNQKATEIVALEYFVDEDPGVGNGTAFTIDSGATIDSVFEAVSTGLSIGNHVLCIRAKDDLGKWSIAESRTFEIADCQQPIPDFEIALACTDSVVQITDVSTAVETGATYSWDINNDGTEDYTTVGDIEHTYTEAGVYTISLHITNPEGCTYTISKQIEVFETPSATILSGGISEICFLDTLTLETTADMASYDWTNTENTQSVEVTSTGIYGVTITDVNGCQAKDEVEITVNPLPEISLGNDTTLCETETLVLNPGAFASYLWSDASTENTLMVSEAGEYWLEVTDENSCSNVDTIMVAYNLIDSVFIDTTICEGGQVLGFSESGFYTLTEVASTGCDSIVELQLTVNNVDTTQQSESICAGDVFDFYGNNLSEAGTYYHTMNSSLNCDSVIQLTLNVNPLPTVDLGNDTALCESETLLLNPGTFASYLWSDASTENTLTVSEAGEYWVAVTDENSCSNSDTIWVAYNLIDSIFIDTTICEGNSVMGFDQSGEYFVTETSLLTGCDSIIHLQLTVNNVDTTVQNGAICDGESFEFYGSQLTTAGTYYQTLTSSLNCDSVIQLQLMVNPVYSFSETQAICQGETLSWHGEDYAEAGTYFANYTTSNGCDSIFELELSVNDLPVVDLGPDDSITTNESLVLDAGESFESYLWNTDETTQSITVDGESLGIGEYEYWVWVTDANTCQNGDTVLITVTLADGITQSSALVKVYPNPVQDVLIVEYTKAIESIQLLNLDGKVLKQFDAINQKVVSISVDEWQQGSYLLRINTADKETQVIKIVKNN